MRQPAAQTLEHTNQMATCVSRRAALVTLVAISSGCGGGGGNSLTDSAIAVTTLQGLSLVDLRSTGGIDASRAQVFLRAEGRELELQRPAGMTTSFLIPIAATPVPGRLVVRQDGVDIRNEAITVVPGVASESPGQSALGFMRGSLQLAEQALALALSSGDAAIIPDAQATRDAARATLAMVEALIAGNNVDLGVGNDGQPILITPDYLFVMDLLAERALAGSLALPVAVQLRTGPIMQAGGSLGTAASAEASLIQTVAEVESANQYVQLASSLAGYAAIGLGAAAAILGAPVLVPVATFLTGAAIVSSVLGNLGSIATKHWLGEASTFGTSDEVVGLVTTVATARLAPGIKQWGKEFAGFAARLQPLSNVNPAYQYGVRQAHSIVVEGHLGDGIEAIARAANSLRAPAPAQPPAQPPAPAPGARTSSVQGHLQAAGAVGGRSVDGSRCNNSDGLRWSSTFTVSMHGTTPIELILRIDWTVTSACFTKSVQGEAVSMPLVAAGAEWGEGVFHTNGLVVYPDSRALYEAQVSLQVVNGEQFLSVTVDVNISDRVPGQFGEVSTIVALTTAESNLVPIPPAPLP